MSKQKRILITIFVLINGIFCFFAFAGDNAVIMEATPQSAFIGDIIKYKISFIVPAGAQIRLPEISKSIIGPFQIKDFFQREERLGPAKKRIILVYSLAAYETGKLKIPEYNLSYRSPGESQWNEIKSSSLEINVASLLEGDKNPRLKSLKGKFGIWQSWLWRGLLILFAAGLAALAIFFLRRRKKEEEKIFSIKPAHAIAYEELDKLKELRLVEKGLFKEFFDGLSSCMRHYLENRFNLKAPRMSTEEFLEKAKTSTLLDSAWRKMLRDVLELSDLVKFARYGSSLKEAEESFSAVKNFIDNTKEKEARE